MADYTLKYFRVCVCYTVLVANESHYLYRLGISSFPMKMTVLQFIHVDENSF